ncbi:hypothetical protein HMI56_003883 [Coelomomyces lativittatus]|nr:hypothetical protein HMI56_003883 [Coelomomyces lativittatus]
MINEDLCCFSYKEILKILERQFGDPSRGFTARRELLRIRQSRRTVRKFNIEFNSLAIISKLNEVRKKLVYINALNDDIRDELSHVEEPKYLSDLLQLCSDWDDRFHAQKNERTPLRREWNNPFIRQTSSSY